MRSRSQGDLGFLECRKILKASLVISRRLPQRLPRFNFGPLRIFAGILRFRWPPSKTAKSRLPIRLGSWPPTATPPRFGPDCADIAPAGTRVVHLSGGIGFLVAHDDYPPMWIPLDGFVPRPAPLDKASQLIESRAHSMTGSDVLRFGYYLRPSRA
jgi:hypothetical protein